VTTASRRRPPWLIAWTAPDAGAEARVRAALAADLEAGGAERLARLAASRPARCRPEHPLRGAAVVSGVDEALAALRRPAGPAGARRPVALLLPGHGSQHERMAAQLYRDEPVFTAAMDAFFTAFGAGGPRLRSAWLSGAPLDAPGLGQPLLYAVGTALARTITGWGAAPSALVGHSIGELAAATAAGVLRPEDGARLLARRQDGYRTAPEGSLLAVMASAEDVRPHLADGVCVGVVNAPRQVMLAGERDPLADTEKRLRDAGYGCVQARIPVPFHSPALAPLARKWTAAVSGVPLSPPRVRVYSTRTGRPVAPAQARDAGFWAEQVCLPVLFWPALDALLTEQDAVLVEAGPGRALTQIARRHPAVVRGTSAAVAALPGRPGPDGADRRALLGAAVRLWTEGHDLDWAAVG
jgi:acyl transferase domain-containing protein